MINPVNHIPQIIEIIQKNNYKKIILQLSKQHLQYSFELTKKLRQQCEKNIQFYTLYDSLKKQCCTDILGAKHVDYDGLFHFGYACFSESYQNNHHYILPTISQEQWKLYEQKLQVLAQIVKAQGIRTVLCDQSIYKRLLERQKDIVGNSNASILRLPFDVQEKQNSKYFGFSYYYSHNSQLENNNVLVIGNKENEIILQNMCLCKNSLKIDRIFTVDEQMNCKEYTKSSNMKLMQRISQSSQLQSKEIFGILVSNPSTAFCQTQIRRCRQLLDEKKLKHFTFMMNNLNEVKLGNFPQIQVYIVISCYNHSLYVSKDFHHLVVTPFDLQIAFGEGKYENYNFDLNKQGKTKEKQDQKQKEEEMEQMKKQDKYEGVIMKVNNQVMIKEAIQTLEHYKTRQYKGLDFSDKKQVQKMKKGKIGLAEQYEKL